MALRALLVALLVVQSVDAFRKLQKTRSGKHTDKQREALEQKANDEFGMRLQTEGLSAHEWPWSPSEPKIWTLDDVSNTCPIGTHTLVDKLTNAWYSDYQGTDPGMLGGIIGKLWKSLFKKDDRTENMQASWADKFTVSWYAAALHLALRNYETRHADSVLVPTKMGMNDVFKVGNIAVPFVDTDMPPKSLPFPMPDANCINDILRTMPFNDWMMDDAEHPNNWDPILRATGGKFENKKDWVQSYYKHYKTASGEAAYPAEAINLRANFLKNDEWNDKLEMHMAFDLIGTHRVEPAKRKFGGETLIWALKLNSLAGLEVRPGFGKYAGDMYFTDEGMPALLVTPDGVEVARGHKDWQYWKFVWRSSLVGAVTLIDHLHATHFRAANHLCRQIREALPPDHPVRRLLSIFTFATVEVNSGAMHSLVGPNHGLHRTLPFKGFQSLSEALPQSLPDPVQQHKYFLDDAEFELLPKKLQNTPYFKDGRVLFKALERLLSRYSALVENMCDDKGVLVDPDMIRFRDVGVALNEEGGYAGMAGDSNQCGVLAKRLLAAVWSVTGYHRHVGTVIEYVDPDLAAFSWKDGERFGRPKQYMLVSVIGATTAKIQPKLSEDYSHIFAGMEKRSEAVHLWKTFQQELEEVKTTIADNNRDREVKNFHFDPDIVECSVAV